MSISGAAKLAGVVGWPVSHSKSPALHGHWLARHGIDGAYVPLAVAPDRFDRAVGALADLGFVGCNVTIPHKEAALALCDELAPVASNIGAVNTIVIDPDGRLFGDNTDAFGFLENLRQGAPGWQAASGPAVVLGAGGAGRAIIAALLEDGAPEIRLLNRTFSRAEELAAHFGPAVHPLDWSNRAECLSGAALLVNTTSLGMTGQPSLDIALDDLPATAVVTDNVYAPLMTPLLSRAQDRGNPVVDGLGMLLHQARPGFSAWFGVEPVVDEDLRRAVIGDG
ncbi:MAG: shikimate dehydrogenase [Pseudomonadota bacterium]